MRKIQHALDKAKVKASETLEWVKQHPAQAIGLTLAVSAVAVAGILLWRKKNNRQILVCCDKKEASKNIAAQPDVIVQSESKVPMQPEMETVSIVQPEQPPVAQTVVEKIVEEPKHREPELPDKTPLGTILFSEVLGCAIKVVKGKPNSCKGCIFAKKNPNGVDIDCTIKSDDVPVDCRKEMRTDNEDVIFKKAE